MLQRLTDIHQFTPIPATVNSVLDNLRRGSGWQWRLLEDPSFTNASKGNPKPT
jgi:hypothetical protein